CHAHQAELGTISHRLKTGWQSFWSKSADVLSHGRREISHLSPSGRAHNTSITRQRVCRFGDTRITFGVFEGWTSSLNFPLWNQYWVKASTSSKPRLRVFSSSMSAF